jgi:hypothetical protein
VVSQILAISEKQGNEHGAASTYHQLGRIAQEQRDFAQAGSGIANPWPLVKKSRATSMAPLLSTTNWASLPKNSSDFPRPSGGYQSLALEKSRATSMAPPTPTTNWAHCPRTARLAPGRAVVSQIPGH